MSATVPTRYANYPMLDFPTAWRLARRGLVHTSWRCSYVQTWGTLLCDCGAVEEEYKRIYEPVHSGFVPSCLDALTSSANGLRVGFGEDSVNCPICLRLWREQGLPKYAVRLGETNAEFLRRTGQS